VVEEAATDVIALWQARGVDEAWRHVEFLDQIAVLQRVRQIRAAREAAATQFHDRSAVCTAALARYLGFPITDALQRELTRIRNEELFQRRVFFVQSLGFVAPTAARRISYDEALRFERIHEETYHEFGFEIISVSPGSVAERVEAIMSAAS